MATPQLSGYLSRALEQYLNRPIEPRIRKNPFASGELVPVLMDLEAGADTVTIPMLEDFGRAELRESIASDIPISASTYAERSYPIRAIWTMVRIDFNEQRRQAFVAAKGLPNILKRKFSVSRRAVEETENQIVAFGKPNAGFSGFINHPDVTVTTESGFNPFAAASTFAEIYDFIYELFVSLDAPNTIIVSSRVFKLLSSPRGVVGNTLMDELIKNLAPLGLMAIKVATELDGESLNEQGVLGDATKDRIIIYDRNPESLERHAEPLMRAPEEQRNGSTFIPIFKCITPVMINYPDSIGYFDVLNAAA